MAILQLLLSWLVGLIAKDLAVPVVEDAITGKLQPPPSTIVDAPRQDSLNTELQNDLQSQIHAGSD